MIRAAVEDEASLGEMLREDVGALDEKGPLEYRLGQLCSLRVGVDSRSQETEEQQASVEVWVKG